MIQIGDRFARQIFSSAAESKRPNRRSRCDGGCRNREDSWLGFLARMNALAFMSHFDDNGMAMSIHKPQTLTCCRRNVPIRGCAQIMEGRAMMLWSMAKPELSDQARPASRA